MRKLLVLIFTGIICAMLLAAGCTSSPATTPATPAATTAPATAAATTAPAEVTTAVMMVNTTATTTTIAGQNITAAATTAAAARAPASWNGTWNTSYSVKDSADAIELLTLTQAGSSVTGTYGNGNGTITATVKESRITGTWNDTDNTGVYSGFFVFEKAADDKSFKGLWVNTPDGEEALKNTTQYWNGVRV